MSSVSWLAGRRPERTFLLHALLLYGDAIGTDSRHLLQRPGQIVPPGGRQLEVVLEDRAVGQTGRSTPGCTLLGHAARLGRGELMHRSACRCSPE